MTLQEYISQYSSNHCVPNISFTLTEKEVKSINIYYSFLNLKYHQFSDIFLKKFKGLKKNFNKEIGNLSYDFKDIGTGMPGVWFASKFKGINEIARCIYFKVKPFKVLILLYNLKSKRLYKSYYTYIKDKKDVEVYLGKRHIMFNNKYNHILEIRPSFNGLLEKDKVVITAGKKTPLNKLAVNGVFKGYDLERKVTQKLRRIGAIKTCEGYDFLNKHKSIYFHLKNCSDLKKLFI